MPWKWLADRFGGPWEWLREGFLQFSLAAAWKGRTFGLPAEISERFRREVLAPFLEWQWLPGVQGVVAELPGDFPTAAPEAVAAVRSVAACFVRLWPGARLKALLDSNEGASGRIEAVGELVRRSLDRAKADEWREVESGPAALPAEGSFFLPWTEKHCVAAWAGQARALLAWEKLRPEVVAAARDRRDKPGGSPADGWREACRNALALIDARNERGAPALWQALARLQSASDYQLFEKIRGVLEDVLDQAETRAPAPEENLEPPPDWPPLLLARLQQSGLPDLLTGLDPDLEEDQKEGLEKADAARVALIRGVTQWMDKAAGAAPPEVWEHLTQFAEKLFGDRPIYVEVVRKWDDQARKWFPKGLQVNDRAEYEEVRQTGLLLCRDGRAPEILRELGGERPPEPTRLVQALQDFERDWLSGHPELGMSEACRSLRERFRGLSTPEHVSAWWEAGGPARFELWWFLQRLTLLYDASEDSRRFCDPILAALEEQRFRLEPGDVGDGTGWREDERLPWLLLGPAAAGPTPTLGDKQAPWRGPFLCGPDGKRLVPAVWLRLSGRRRSDRCLVEFRPQVQRVLARLQSQDDPEWSGWKEYNDQVGEAWFWSLRNDSDGKQQAKKAARDWFTKFQERKKARADLKGDYEILVKDVIRCLRRLGVEIQSKHSISPEIREGVEALLGDLNKLPPQVGGRLCAQLADGKDQFKSRTDTQEALEQFHRALWGNEGVLLRGDEKRFERIVRQLDEVLKLLGLKRYKPKKELADYRGNHSKEVEIVSESTGHGRLKRTLMPGLMNAKDEVRVRAVAEYA